MPRGSVPLRRALLVASLLVAVGAARPAGPPLRTPGLFVVTTTADSGEGSLRDALERASALPGPQTIRFESVRGPFAEPRTIELRSELSVLRGEITIDGYIEDRLWKPTGVTLSGGKQTRILRVGRGARVVVKSISIADGRGGRGGGALNEGHLVVKGVTFLRNASRRDGGALASAGGEVTILNSSFAQNEAGENGGALAILGGAATVTNCTFSENRARRGGGLFSRGALLLRNTILANSAAGMDCVVVAGLDPRSTHNLIVTNEGCGSPIVARDPKLEKLALYNGPTPTMPLGGGSPAINLGDNAAAADEDGTPLAWDQRGNGDPRRVAGFTDIGAFEVQAFPVLRVNTREDSDLRACSGAGESDCPLRGAIALANAANGPQVITFDAGVFATPGVIDLARALPEVTVDLMLDARGTGGVTLRGAAPVLRAAPGRHLVLAGVRVEPRR